MSRTVAARVLAQKRGGYRGGSASGQVIYGQSDPGYCDAAGGAYGGTQPTAAAVLDNAGWAVAVPPALFAS